MMRFDSEHDLLVIPDVHGRTFWREALNKPHWSHVLFLGDYTDPYPHEYISVQQAYDNFVDIIGYAVNHPSQTTLLLGNHDMHYKSAIFRRLAMGSRYSSMMAQAYTQLFDTYDQLFSLAFEAEYEGERCLFTHAGVVPEWYRIHAQQIGELNAETLNRLAQSDEGMAALADVGWSRGGLSPVGGPLWADCMEMTALEDGPYQIFGHTQNYENQAVVTPHYACVDTHRGYLLSEILAGR